MSEIRVVRMSDIRRCPKMSLLPGHYRDDGTCRCNESEEAAADVTRLQDELAKACERKRRS